MYQINMKGVEDKVSHNYLIQEHLLKLKSLICNNSKNPINQYINMKYSPHMIQIEDDADYHYQQQYLKRVYHLQQYSLKIQLLSQYYKYHSQLPRIFLFGICSIMEEHNEAKRQLQYIQVTKKIKQFNKEEQQIQRHVSTSNVLDGLQLSTNLVINQISEIKQPQKKMKRVISVHQGFTKGVQPKEGLFISNRKNQKPQIYPKQSKELNGISSKNNQIKEVVQRLTKKRQPTIDNVQTKDSKMLKKISDSKSKPQMIPSKSTQKRNKSNSNASNSKAKIFVKSNSNANLNQCIKKSITSIGQNTKNQKSKQVTKNLFKSQSTTSKGNFSYSNQNKNPKNQSKNTKRGQEPGKRMFMKLIEAKKRWNL